MYSYSIHDLVTIRSDQKLYLPGNLQIEDVTDPDVRVEIGAITYDEEVRQQLGSDYYWDAETKSLILDHGLDVKAEIRDLTGDCVVRATSSFVKRGNLDQLTLSVITYRLLSAGATFVHSGGLRGPDESTVMVQAWDDMGKTSTVLSLLARYDCEFLGDDSLIIHDGKIHSFARKISISGGTIVPDGVLSRRERWESKARTMLNSVVPLGLVFRFFPSRGMGLPPERIIPQGRFLGIGDGVSVDACVFLQPEDPSSPDVQEVSSEEAQRRSVINSHLVGTGVKGNHHLAEAYFYSDEGVDEEILTDRHDDLVRAFFQSVPCYEVTTPKPAYVDTIAEHLGWD